MYSGQAETELNLLYVLSDRDILVSQIFSLPGWELLSLEPDTMDE